MGKNEEEEAKEKLQAELKRLRRDFAARSKKAYDDINNAEAAQEAPKPEVEEHLYRTLKVVWRKDISEYPVAKLREIFGVFGVGSARFCLPRQSMPFDSFNAF